MYIYICIVLYLGPLYSSCTIINYKVGGPSDPSVCCCEIAPFPRFRTFHFQGFRVVPPTCGAIPGFRIFLNTAEGDLGSAGGGLIADIAA